MGGQDQAKGKILRLGHMGFITDQDMIETMDIVSRTSQGIGNAVNAGASGLLGKTPSSINNLLNVGA